MNDFDIVLRDDWNWTLMSVACRGRQFPACDRNANFTDWRAAVPSVPYSSLPAICFVLTAHVLVFLGVSRTLPSPCSKQDGA
jgi:hypothetical protein